jgi:hypothetical protein
VFRIGALILTFGVTKFQENLEIFHKVWNSLNWCKQLLKGWITSRRMLDLYSI